MDTGALGRDYQDGEIIFHQGDEGHCMYVILDGTVEVYLEKDGQELSLKLCRESDFLGEMAIFRGDVRSASARAIGKVRMLTIDKKNFLRRIHEDPSIAFRLVEGLSQRIADLNEDVSVLNHALQECLDNRIERGDI